MDDGKLATAHSQMPQLPPSFSEGTRVGIESVPRLLRPCQRWKSLNLPIGLAARPEPLVTSSRKTIIRIARLYCDGRVLQARKFQRLFLSNHALCQHKSSWRNSADEALHKGEKAWHYDVPFWKSEMFLTQVKGEYLVIKQIWSSQKNFDSCLFSDFASHC